MWVHKCMLFWWRTSFVLQDKCVRYVHALKDEMSWVQGFGWADIWEQWDGSGESDCKKTLSKISR